MAGGRPTLYNDEIQSLANSYVDGHYEQCDDAIPSVAGLSIFLDVSRDSLYEWGRVHPEFSDTLKKCLIRQEKVALTNGLNGKFNSTITKLVLANHGYADKVQQEVGGIAGGKPVALNVSFVDPLPRIHIPLPTDENGNG